MSKAREIEGLDCGASANAGIILVLRSRLEEMCAFRAAALDWSDPEGVHDMRVASRRLRSVVRDFSPFLRKRKLRNSGDDLKAIADALGSVRDQDVAIMALEKLAAEAPPEVAAGIEQFANERRAKQRRARSRLEDALVEDALGEFQEDFNAAIERALKVSRKRKSVDGQEKAVEGTSFRQVGCEIITARFQELEDLSVGLSRPLKLEPLHRMRIAAKRLRYSIELFDACWSESLAPFAKEIAKLQTSLGELHDCDVWILALQDEVTGGTSTASGAERRNAACWLLDRFMKERTNHFLDALTRWHEWETTGFQAHLNDILNDKSPAVESASTSPVRGDRM